MSLVDLLPHLRALSVSGVEFTEHQMSIAASVPGVTATCPACGRDSWRVHSRHQRQVNDGVIGARQIVLHLQVRRFFCMNPACPAMTFTEQVAGLTEPYRRRSIPLLGLLAKVGLALAGRAGARLAAAMGIVVHPTTLIRLVRRLPEPELTASPQVLGVDDFAFKRGHQYGTILVDMDTGKTIDLLDGRDADPLADWLRAHPGARVICRDRAGAYADGAAQGAPQATQVADRWHLWNNLCDHVANAVTRHRSSLQPPAPAEPEDDPGGDSPTDSVAFEAVEVPEARLVTRTRERYAQVQERVAAGDTISAISRALNLNRRTVRRFARATDLEDLLVRSVGRSDLLTPHKAYLHKRWNQGVTDAAQLTKEIAAHGYPGSQQTVRRYLQPFRSMTTLPEPPPPAPTVRQVTGWLLRRPDTLDTDEKEKLAEILDRCPGLQALSGHVQAFAEMMTGLTGQNLPDWLAGVEADDQPELRSFATGIRRDLDAVTAGLTLPHSSGKVEGNVNRLKAIKRQMYGRAGLDLLRKRLVLGT